MMARSRFGFVLIFLLVSLKSFGQSDSLNTLSISDFLQIIKKHHPLAKQADLITKSADANTLVARGSFDPKLAYDFNNKFYDSKSYYELGKGGFSVPTWFGVEFKSGFEQNQGPFLNPENLMPEQGLAYTQISVPLLQGLLIDERRATLKQALLFKQLSEFDKINALNDLLYKAGKAYWEWHLSFTNLKVYQNAVDLSQIRYEAAKRTTALGDRPAIDTVEANIQLQERIINLQQATMDYRTKSLLLSNFLWIENDTPIELTNQTVPDAQTENYDNASVAFLNTVKVDSIIELHPSLRIYDYKLQQLNIEKRFKQDKFKPIVNLNYNPLFDPNSLNGGYLNNYKFGLSFSFPLFLRKERGELQLTKIKIQNTNFETINKRNELLNKTKATINEFNTYRDQIEVYRRNLINYERLWQSELRLFDLGESSLFMVNSRELSYINAQLKLNEIINKNRKSALDVEFAAGVLNSIY